MATEGTGKLEAWEDRPRRDPTADLTTAHLDSQRAFLLTRLDGSTSISDLCNISGMTEGDTLAALADLVGRGLVIVEHAPGRRTPIAAEARADEPRSAVSSLQPSSGISAVSQVSSGVESEPAEPMPVMEQVENLPDFHGVSPADAQWLSARGELWRVPGMPWRRPGDVDRYGRYQFDRRALLRHCDLTIAQRREVMFMHDVGPKLDHFEFFGMEPTADRSEWRKAYFRFTKQFHPDAYFRKETGDFKPLLEAVYRRGTLVHDTVAGDAELRERYLRAVLARDEAYRQALLGARERYEAAKREIELRREARAQEAALRLAARRRIAVQERLQANIEARRERVNPANELIRRAAVMYDEGMQHYRGQKFLEAASALRMAMTYDPENEVYAQAHARVSEKANAVRAEHAWKLGFMQESVGRMEGALTSYLEAVKLQPRPDYCLHCAELMLTLDVELHRAAELARIASDADPQNVEYLLLLGRIYERVNLMVKAAGVLERAQKLAPKDERIKKALKALKK